MGDATKFLARHLKKLMKDPPFGCNACPNGEDLMNWTATIFGPRDSIWEGGIFHLSMKFSQRYPQEAPKVKFITPIFHPNVYSNGDICLDILNSKWSPIYDVAALLTSIQSMLTDPNPDSPANATAAELLRKSPAEYERRVRACVGKSIELDASMAAGSEDEEDEEDASEADADAAGEGAGGKGGTDAAAAAAPAAGTGGEGAAGAAGSS